MLGAMVTLMPLIIFYASWAYGEGGELTTEYTAAYDKSSY